MTMKEKIIEVLKENKLTIKEITEKINKEYAITTTEPRIRSYIKRLKDDDMIEKCGIDNRYKVYKLKSNVHKGYNEDIESLNTQILKKMIPKFIEFGIMLESTTEKEDQRIMELIDECQ